MDRKWLLVLGPIIIGVSIIFILNIPRNEEKHFIFLDDFTISIDDSIIFEDDFTEKSHLYEKWS